MKEGHQPTGRATGELAEKLTKVLMGTQCTQCGYPSCEAYALALAQEEALPNRCRPGGAVVMRELQAVLGQRDETLVVLQKPEESKVAQVEEQVCIGCTLCSQVCPTDAVVGAARQRHTVLADDCTGCGLCVPVCPVACIDLVAIATDTSRLATDQRPVNWRSVTAKRRRNDRVKMSVRKKPGTARETGLENDVVAGVATGDLQQQIAAARAKARVRHGHLAGQILGPKVSGA